MRGWGEGVRNPHLEIRGRACIWLCVWGRDVELIQCRLSDTTPSSAPASLGGWGWECW